MGGLFGGGGTTISTSETAALGVRIQSSAYGLPIPIVYGRNRVPGNLIWYGNFTPVPHTETTSSGGGKGGGGETTSTNTTYTYTASFALAVAEGPVTAINACWKDKDYIPNATQTLYSYGDPTLVPGSPRVIDHTSRVLLAPVPIMSGESNAFEPLLKDSGIGRLIGALPTGFATGFADKGVRLQVPTEDGFTYAPLTPGIDYTFSAGVYTFTSANTPGSIWRAKSLSPVGQTVLIAYSYFSVTTTPALFSGFPGTYPQAAWSYLTSCHPGQDVTYQGVAYVAAANYDLGSDASLPNHTFDVTGRLPFDPAGGIYDANPRDVLVDFLTNPHYGAGFPAAKVGNLSAFSNYCIATGLFLSPVYSSQAQASESVSNLCKLANCAPFFSEGVLKVAPYGDAAVSGHGVNYTPNTTPLYDLNDDDFIADTSTDPVRLTRGSVSDAFNSIQIEFVNRTNEYNVEISEARDQVAVDVFGLRTADPLQAHEISDPAVARRVAQLLLQRSLFIRNTYEFSVGWKYCLLEPMDLVTLTDAVLGLDRTPVRITSIEENDDGTFTLQAEDFLAGVSSSPRFPVQALGGYAANYNAAAGNANDPIVFEAPDLLTTNGLEIWIGASGPDHWGGSNIWISLDGNSYKQVGSITNPARQGVLTTPLAKVDDPDKTSVLGVDLSMSGGQLNAVSQAEADAFATLCYVDGELIAFRDATLTAANRYDLGYLRRGAYGSTVKAHAAGTPFLRLDEAVFKYPFTADMIGKTIYLKLQSFNPVRGGLQALADVPAYAYTITGAALYSPLPNVQNMTTNFVAGQTVLYWDEVADFRQPNVDYEVRLGATWAAASVLGRTPTPHFTTLGDGTYWIAAHYQTLGGFNAYSAAPVSVAIAGSRLVQNVVASYDEAATGWGGTLDGGLVQVDNRLTLQGGGNLLACADLLAEPDIIYLGGVAGSGSYELPPAHAVNVGRVAPCSVSISYTAYAQSIYDNLLTVADLLSVSDLLSAALGQKVVIQPQIAMAGEDGIYGDWQNFVPGVFNAQYFKARVRVGTSDPQVTAFLTGLTFTVDVPDRIDGAALAVPAAGISVAYGKPFNGGPGGLAVPLVQATLVNAQAGDDVVLTDQTASGFTVQVINGGVGVARTINWLAQGY